MFRAGVACQRVKPTGGTSGWARRLVVLLVLALVGTACAGDSGEDAAVPPDVDSEVGAVSVVPGSEPDAPEAPAPEELEVLAQQAVGSSGAVVSAGEVSVSVPEGAFSGEAAVTVYAPLGEFGDEVGGEVVSVDHQGPVRVPVTVVWNVSHLSEAEQQLVLLVRWDEALGGWLPGDADFEISGGTLTARIQEWSLWTWIANTSQTIQEVVGRRIDAPRCSSGALHDWVSDVTEPDEDTNAASIRMCYENGPDESVRVRLANNRVFSQVVFINGSYGLWDSELTGFDLSLSGLAHEAAHYFLSVEGDEAMVFLPPLRYVDVVIQRPSLVGPHNISFRNEVSETTFIADGIFILLDLVGDFAPVGQTSPFLQALLEVIFDCGAPQIVKFFEGSSTKHSIDLATDILTSCVPKIANPNSELGRLFRQKIEEYTNSAMAAGIERLSSKLGRALRGLKLVELAGYLGDLAAENLTGSLAWNIRGQGRVGSLGNWIPTCTNPEQDSNRIWKHLVLREPFTPPGSMRAAENLHRFDEWMPSAEKAVAPLRACSDGHNTAVANDVADWFGGDEPAASSIVANLIRALVSPDNTETSVTHTFKAVSAGSRDSCGIRTDDSIVCWFPSRTDVPTGGFKAVSEGLYHGCGLRTDDTITCWGYNVNGQADAPAGGFVAVSAGDEHSCGLRVDDSIVCWGENEDGQADAPAGVFEAVDVSGEHSCGLRVDDSIVCWGSNEDWRGNYTGQADPPAGAFKAVSAGAYHSCGLRVDDTITCWGDNDGGQADAPAGAFKAVSAGGGHSCGLRVDDTITCWGDNDGGQADAPAGAFKAVSAGGGHSCGLRVDDTITCWGSNSSGQTIVPGDLMAVSAGDNSCGIRVDDTVVCWSPGFGGQADVPTGAFKAVSVSGTSLANAHSCGIRADDSVFCWGNNEDGQADAPTGAFKAVNVGDYHSCGLRVDDTIFCWGNNEDGQADAPTGAFKAVSVGGGNSCGLRVDDSIVCWGDNSWGQTDAPTGAFKAVSAGVWHICGIRTDDRITCWGNSTAYWG